MDVLIANTFVAMQLFMFIAGLAMLKKDKRLDGSKWFGRVSTAVFYAVMLVLVALPELSEATQNILMMVCGIFLTMSFVLYIREYIRMYMEAVQEERA